jgi:hypothetical protein
LAVFEGKANTVSSIVTKFELRDSSRDTTHVYHIKRTRIYTRCKGTVDLDVRPSKFSNTLAL